MSSNSGTERLRRADKTPCDLADFDEYSYRVLLWSSRDMGTLATRSYARRHRPAGFRHGRFESVV